MTSATAPDAHSARPGGTTSGVAERDLSRALYLGIAIWATVSAALVALQGGVVIDETVVAGQIISGLVTYPGGHPHDVFYKTAYTLPGVAAGWFLAVWESEVALSAIRNWIFLAMSLVTVFTVTFGVARRASWAHLATALTLLGGHLSFGGTYPMNVFPIFYGHGHVGLQMVLLAGGLLIARQWLVGGLAAGLVPAIHATMTLAVWPWMALYLLTLARLGHTAEVRRALLGWGATVVVSIAVAFLIPLTSTPLAPVPPYDGLAGLEGARAGFAAVSDTHRMLPVVASRPYLLGPIAFLALGWVLLWIESPSRRDWTEKRLAAAGLLGFGALSIAIVYGGLVLETLLGGLPEILFLVMPYRFSNVPAALLVSVGVALLAATADRTRAEDRWVVRAVPALLFAAVGVAMSGLAGERLRDSVTTHMLTVVWGVGFGLAFWALASSARSRVHLGASFLALTVAAAALWAGEKTALYLLVVTAASGGAAWILARLDLRAPRLERASVAGLGLATVACALGAASVRFADIRYGPTDTAMISADDLRIRSWLADNAAPDEMVLISIGPRIEVQAKTRQPVLFEAETLWLMTYMPDLAPRMGTMVRDLYDVDYGRPEQVAARCPDGQLTYWCDVWNASWPSRTPAEWATLGRKYDFRIVIAAAELDLQLPLALRAGIVNLYTIPNGDGPEESEHVRAVPR